MWFRERGEARRGCGSERGGRQEEDVVQREGGGKKRMWFRERGEARRGCGSERGGRQEEDVVQREGGGKKRMWFRERTVVILC